MSLLLALKINLLTALWTCRKDIAMATGKQYGRQAASSSKWDDHTQVWPTVELHADESLSGDSDPVHICFQNTSCSVNANAS